MSGRRGGEYSSMANRKKKDKVTVLRFWEGGIL
jgi:hypothetical protein